MDRGIRSALPLLATSVLAWPGLQLERVGFGRRVRSATLEQGPVFILGHYRSGTTLLHKLLAADPRLAALTTFEALLPGCPVALQRVLRPPLQRLLDLRGVRQPFFHDYGLRLDDPIETEAWWLAAGFPWSSYWGYVFPRRADYLDRWIDPSDPEVLGSWLDAYDRALRRLTFRSGGRRPVVKDPPNTARAALLAERYPRARFVYLYRDPARVLLSMWRLWRRTIEPLIGLQRLTDAERCDRIASHYLRLLTGYQRDRPRLTSRLVELRFEDFAEDPIDHLRHLYHTLDIGDFDPAKAAIGRRLQEERSYRQALVAGEPLPDELTALAEHWRTRLGYATAPVCP